MRSLYSRLLIAYAVLLATALIGLGVILGRFFPLLIENPTITTYYNYLIVALIIVFL